MVNLLKLLEDRRSKDWRYESGRVFSSMCSKPLKKAVEAYSMFLETNMLDSKIFPSVQGIEGEVIEKMGKLLSRPSAGGYITSGGTEGNITALWVARKLLKRKTVVAPISAHYSVEKACDLQQMKLIRTKLDGKYRADVESIKKNVSMKTLAIVATAGTTSLGSIDPIEEIAEIAEDFGCFLHVDASFGGFILPFVKNPPHWDFRVNRVSSITADPHKMGLAPIPAGCLLFREKRWLKNLKVDVPYLSRTSTTLLGTRPGGSAAAVWMALNSLGNEGYRKLVKRCIYLAQTLARGTRKIEGLDLVVEPELNIVAFKSDAIDAHNIRKALETKNWLVSVIDWPKSLRLVVMPHHRLEHINLFLADLAECMEELI